MFDQRVRERVADLIDEAKGHILDYYPESREMLSVFQFAYKSCTSEDFSRITLKHAPKKKELPWAFTLPRETSPLIQMKYSPGYEVLTGKLGMESYRDNDIRYNEKKLMGLKGQVGDEIFEAFLHKSTIHELLESMIRSLPMNYTTDPEDIHPKIFIQTELVLNSV